MSKNIGTNGKTVLADFSQSETRIMNLQKTK